MQGGPEFFFIINIQVSSIFCYNWPDNDYDCVYLLLNFKLLIMKQVPGSTTYSLALYYMMTTPLEDAPLLESFVKGDDTYRNSRFKLIPYISKVSAGSDCCNLLAFVAL